MKTNLTLAVTERAALLLLLSTLSAQLSTVFAQGTAFTYQGRLNNNGSPANGIYDLLFTIYDLPTGSGAFANQTNSATAISNGLFTVTLDFGPGIFTGPDRWLEIGVRTNGSISAHTPLVPRQPLTAAPYAVHAGTVGAVSWNSISGVPVVVMSNMLGSVGNQPLELKVNGQRVLRLEPTTNAPNLIGGHGGNFVSNGVVGATIAGGGAPGLANLVGASHGTVGGGIANAALGAQSVVAGGGHNVASGRSSFIGGGGGFDAGGGGPYPNITSGDWSTIGGGWLNSASGNSSTIAGGALNESGTNALFAATGGGVGNINLGYAATIAGGYYNRAENNSATVSGGEFNFASGVGTAIAGGASNTNLSSHATIAGGRANLVEPGADLSAIGGGVGNYIQNTADQSVIAGGNSGRIEGGSRESFIGGGFANTIRSNSLASFIGGGAYNTNGPGAAFATISGGENGLNSGYAGTIAGGYYNTVTINGATVGGGSLNTASGANSVVAGGERNFAQARWAVIGGGVGNSITNQGNALTIGGGQGNHISSGQNYSTIAGGVNNLSANRSDRGFIGGGSFNTLGQFTYHGTIGGGQGNATFFNAQYPTLLGGLSNLVANSGSVIPGGLFNTNAGNISVISGGESNYIGFLADHSVIGGGAANRVVGSQLLDVYAIVGGGGGNTVQTNVSYSTISGGRANTIQANAHYAAIPGGFSNEVAGAYGFAAGRRAKANHPGTFVWTDSTDTNFASTATNQFSVRAGGGVRLETGGAGMTLDGVNVLNGVVPNTSLAGTYSSALTLNNPANAFTGTFNGNGGSLTNLNSENLTGLLTVSNSLVSVGHSYDGGLAYGVAVSGNFAYLANYTDGLRVYNVANPANPVSIGHINDGGQAYGVAVSGNFAYLANNIGGLRVYDIANPANPVSIGHSYDGGFARGVAVSGNFAYLANDNDGLRVYNIANPTNPVSIGHINDGGSAQGVAVSGNFAYLANWSDGLRVYNIANPTNPVSIGHIDDGGTAYGVAVSGNFAYLANSDDGLRVYNIANPTNPVSIGHIDDGGTAYGVAVSGNFAYLANDADGLRVYNIANPTNPVSIGHIDDGGNALGVAVSGNFAYLANNFDGLRVYGLGGVASALGFRGNGSLLTGLIADNITSGTIADARLSANVALLNATQTFTGNNTIAPPATLSFGAQTRQMLNLWNNAFGIGVQSSTLYQRSNDRFSWFRTGIHSDFENDPGVGGTRMMTLTGAGELHVGGGGSAGLSLQNRETADFVGGPTAGERYVWYVSQGVCRLWSGNEKMSINNNGVVTAVTVAANTVTVSGSVRVPGAGIGTTGPAFVHRVTAGNIEAGSTHRTTITHPLCDGDPNAILMITHNYNPGNTGGTVETNPTSVYYHPVLGKWQIYHDNLAPMVEGNAWNVLVIKP